MTDMEIPILARGYRVEQLLDRFDSHVPGQTNLTGRLSSLFGEAVLVEALAHAYVDAGYRIERLAGSPHRDNSVFAAGKRPSQRDLDAWLSLDESDLVAVECKTWTASSKDGSHILDASQDDLSCYARDQWAYVSERLLPPEPGCWDDVNKIRLPLKVPYGYGHKSADIRRVLAIWRPVSESGLDPWTTVICRTPIGPDVWTDVPVQVFSGSLYLRRLLASGISILPAVVTEPHNVRDAVNACIS